MFRRLLAVPAALLGLLGAHELSYRLAVSDATHRHDLLDATGHTWLAVLPLLIVLGVVGLVVASWAEVKTKIGSVRFTHVLALQSSAYVVVEASERLLAGHSPWPGLSLVLAGAITQLPMAFVVWFLLRNAVKAAVRGLATRSLGPVVGHPLSLVIIPASTDISFASIVRSGLFGRAPPLSA